MSLVTDLVFVLPCVPYSEDQANRDRFESGFREAHGWNLAPQEGAGKAMTTSVYVAGVNYLNLRWLEAVRREPWPEGTVLWLHPEEPGADVGQPILYRLGPDGDRELF